MKGMLVLLSGLLLLNLQSAAPASPAISEPGAAAVTGFLKEVVDRGEIPGVVALVVNQERVLYQSAFGKLSVAQNLTMPLDAIFNIASMTKPITSVAVMMLVEEGKLGLDDPVSKYLPQFERSEVLTQLNKADLSYQTRPVKRAITIRHLLSHTSGIGYAFSNEAMALLQKKTGRNEAELPLVHDPGEKWTYGASTRVLGDVVERLSGLRIDAFLHARILEPLGMLDTFYAVPPEKHARVVTRHTRTDGTLAEQPNPPTLEPTIRGDGGLYSTARDYGVFLQMLLNNGRFGSRRLLSERSVRMMGENQIGTVVVTEQPAANPLLTRPFPLGAGRDKFGLGFQIARTPPSASNLRSPGSYSWAGIYNTHFWVDPNRQIGVVLLMQVLPFYDEACIRVLTGVEELIYKHLT